MLYLHYSNQLERLVTPLASVVREQQIQDPLRRVTIVVPSPVVEEFLKLRLAEDEGVAANLEFPFLRRYLARIVERANPLIRVLDAADLQIAVFEFLRTAANSGATDFDPVRSYITAASDKRENRELRLFDLSRRVARLFREYSIVRASMLARWPNAAVLKDARFVATERWQRRTYLSLLQNDGTLRAEWLAESGLRWMLLPAAFRSCEAQRLREALPASLHVFGLGNAGPEFVRIFSSLGEMIELHIYALNPCLEFWEDVQQARLSVHNSWARRRDRIGEALESSEDPFELESTADNLSLRVWGRAGREYIRLLNELTDCDFDPHFAEPDAHGQKLRLLARLQRRILWRESETATHEDEGTPCADESIRFLECPGVRREIEIVANSIWAMLPENGPASSTGKSRQRLRFHQIALLIPDAAREQYLAHVESVFTQQHRIPVNIVDARLSAASRVGEAIELLLRLPKGRFSRDEVLHLLTHPAIGGGRPAVVPELWSDWCRSLGVRFGVDERVLAATYAPNNLYHWDQALKRVALGVFMAGETSGEGRVYRGADQSEYLPFEIPQDATESAAAFVRLTRGLLNDALEIGEQRLTLPEWARVLSEFIATYVHPPDRSGERVRDLIAHAVETMARPELMSTAVSYAVASELALSQIPELEAEQGVYAENGVVVGSLSALRSIPFKAVFLLGLGESIFPQRDPRDLLDLRAERRHAGDVSPAERDRYMFLETILAARERLTLSWVSRNAQTGEALEPSGVVRELQFILASFLKAEELARLTIAHPVSSHDRRYFPELAAPSEEHNPELVSFDRGARLSAAVAMMREDLDNRCGKIPSDRRDTSLIDRFAAATQTTVGELLRLPRLPSKAIGQAHMSEIVLPLYSLKSYLECPLQGAARYALRMHEEDDGKDEDSEHEPLSQPFLDRTILLREALWRGRGRYEDVERYYREAYHRAELKGIAPVGPFGEAARRFDLDKLARAVRQINAMGVEGFDQWQQIAVGGAGELADVDRTIPAIVFSINLPTPGTTRRIRLRGKIGPISARMDCSVRLVAGEQQAHARDFLDGFFSAIVLAAAGEKVPPEFTALAVGVKDDIGTDELRRKFRPPSPSAARKYLRSLATDLFCDANDYFLPIEAVGAIKDRDARTPAQIVEAIEYVCEHHRGCRSDYGPVRDGRRFPAPDPAEVPEIIERRFAPVAAIFSKRG